MIAELMDESATDQPMKWTTRCWRFPQQSSTAFSEAKTQNDQTTKDIQKPLGVCLQKSTQYLIDVITGKLFQRFASNVLLINRHCKCEASTDINFSTRRPAALLKLSLKPFHFSSSFSLFASSSTVYLLWNITLYLKKSGRVTTKEIFCHGVMFTRSKSALTATFPRVPYLNDFATKS